LRAARLEEDIPLPMPNGDRAHLTVLRVEYVQDEPERYVVPLYWAPAQGADTVPGEAGAPIARLTLEDGSERLLVDACSEPAFGRALLGLIALRGRVRSDRSELRGIREGDPQAARAADLDASDLKIRAGSAEQSNTSILYGDRWILKLFRRLEAGVNIDRELGEHLTRRAFPHTPPVLGALDLLTERGERITTAVMQVFVPNQGDAWEFTREALGRFFERVRASSADPRKLPLPAVGLWAGAREPLPRAVGDFIEEAYLGAARLLGQRTGELHRALAAGESPDTRPEPFTQLYQRSLYQSMRNLLGQTLTTLQQLAPRLRSEDRRRAEEILAARGRLLNAFRGVIEHKVDGQRIRIHGDYHLGQVLYTGKDFVVIDFEGEPARPLSERRLKRSPLRDVAGMIRSFHYAAVAALFREAERGTANELERSRLEAWARFWHEWVSIEFLRGYAASTEGAPFLPAKDAMREELLNIYRLEKALYELSYELANRPDWVRIPIAGIVSLLRPEPSA
jgi:maltose alpha-D-glucosyltransferase/alpha-amylase